MTIKFNTEELANDLFTMADWLRWAMSRLNEANVFFGHGTTNAWDDAVNLMLFNLSLPEQQDNNLLQCRLTFTEKKRYVSLIESRINDRMPVAYLTNNATFANLNFYVDSRVLIPRSPIAELILKQFTPYIENPDSVNRVLDLCTGGGCIAIASAYSFPEAEIDAIDLSEDALDVAQINIDGHELNDRVIPIKSNVFSGVSEQKYDLIVTNPPYVDAEDMAALPAEYSHEPAMGLACGDDGLDIVRIILAQAAEHLNDDGILVCEVGNSCVQLAASFPTVPFQWVEFEHGGHGVFVLTKQDLVDFSDQFKQ